MEAEWWRDAHHTDKTLHIINPVPGEVFGYRKYMTVILENLDSLWFEEVPHYLGSINSAMEYGGTIKINCHRRETEKPPEFNINNDRVDGWLYGKGFANVRREGHWLKADKI